jgi:putative aldouronate transport system permease protein
MYGAIIAFKQFSPAAGIWASPWVGFNNFEQFFNSFYFLRLVSNTLMINILGLIFTFPAPVIFALLLNEVRARLFKRTVQTITYVPHFISMVVICGMIMEFVKKDGIISLLVTAFSGGNSQNLLLNPALFRPIYIISDIWQNVGWSSIIYLAAISTIDQELYEAAEIDGANRLRKILSITIPGILPTLMILLILRIGSIMNVGFEKVMLLYNPSIYETADVISTFTYRNGILQGSFSFATAVGLFNSVINCLMVISANQISKRLTEQSLW